MDHPAGGSDCRRRQVGGAGAGARSSGAAFCCWRWRCEVWQGWQAVGAVQVAALALVRGHRGRRSAAGVVIWCGAGGLVLPGAGGRRCDLLRLRCAGVVIVATAATPSACRSADPAGRAGGQAGRRRKRKRPGRRRVVRCCSGLWSALAWWYCCAGPDLVQTVGGGGLFPCSGAGLLLALALFQAQRFQLATFQRGTGCAGGAPSGPFLPFAGGVRFST